MFIRGAWPQINLLRHRRFVSNWHIDAKCDHLEAVSRGEIRRIIINEPPRHMKSLTCNVFWPSWDWIENPGRQFMFSSYRADLSERDNDQAREVVESAWYEQNYAKLLPGRKNTGGDYSNREGGRRLVTSVGGKSSTGDGGDIIVIDDPLSADQARSEKQRQTVIDWWDDTMKSRLNDPVTGAFIVIMQRLHENDLVGHILAKELGWDHLCIPARYERDHIYPIRSSLGFKDPRQREGELLWEKRFPEKALNEIAPEGTYTEAGQLQQRPAPRKGGLFQRDDFTILNECPKIKRWVRGWDLAASLDGDWTVGVRLGERADGEGYVIAHVIRFRKRPAGVETTIYATTENDNMVGSIKQILPQDPGQGGVAQRDNYAKLLSGYPVGFERPSEDKEGRAAPFAAQCELGRVYLLNGAWNEAFLNELTMFPKGKHDDQVDAAATAFNELALGADHGFR